MTKLFVDSIETPLGRMVVAATDTGLSLLEFCEADKQKEKIERFCKNQSLTSEAGGNLHTQQTKIQLSEYFGDERKSFDLSFDLFGTAFQQKIWRSLSDIPHGKTVTYNAQAKKHGDIKAIRAVASANGKNPVAIILPCHRVIGSSGDLTGYAGGLEKKRWLLEFEGALSKALF